MSAPHTAGPWDADIEDVSPTFLHRAVIGANGELVADCDSSRLSAEETAANALLIAAAPELLLCAEILGALHHPDGGRSFPTKQDCAFARGVLAKAKGDL